MTTLREFMRAASQISLISFVPPAANAPQSVSSLYAALRRDIVRLALRPGQRLSENEIALRFGTSRAPVREAFIRLAEEGLIEVRPQRGSFVTRISIAAMQRARFVREAIELSVVRRAAEMGLTADMIEAVERTIVEQQAADDDASAFTSADDGFHPDHGGDHYLGFQSCAKESGREATQQHPPQSSLMRQQ